MERKIQGSFTGVFLMEVIERYTKKVLIEAVIYEVSFLSGWDNASEFQLTQHAKSFFVDEIYKDKQFNPSARKKLDGVTWCIDGVLLEKKS